MLQNKEKIGSHQEKACVYAHSFLTSFSCQENKNLDIFTSKPQIQRVLFLWKKYNFKSHLKKTVLTSLPVLYSLASSWAPLWWGPHRGRAFSSKLMAEFSLGSSSSIEFSRMCLFSAGRPGMLWQMLWAMPMPIPRRSGGSGGHRRRQVAVAAAADPTAGSSVTVPVPLPPNIGALRARRRRPSAWAGCLGLPLSSHDFVGHWLLGRPKRAWRQGLILQTRQQVSISRGAAARHQHAISTASHTCRHSQHRPGWRPRRRRTVMTAAGSQDLPAHGQPALARTPTRRRAVAARSPVEAGGATASARLLLGDTDPAAVNAQGPEGPDVGTVVVVAHARLIYSSATTRALWSGRRAQGAPSNPTVRQWLPRTLAAPQPRPAPRHADHRARPPRPYPSLTHQRRAHPPRPAALAPAPPAARRH